MSGAQYAEGSHHREIGSNQTIHVAQGVVGTAVSTLPKEAVGSATNPSLEVAIVILPAQSSHITWHLEASRWDARLMLDIPTLQAGGQYWNHNGSRRTWENLDGRWNPLRLAFTCIIYL